MGFFKKLFTGIGFAAGFLFFGCLSVIVYASRGRHKPCHRRSSFWNTLERYLIFSWICDGVRSSRKRAETSYYQRTGSTKRCQKRVGADCTRAKRFGG